jgi:hypothetical protein
MENRCPRCIPSRSLKLRGIDFVLPPISLADGSNRLEGRQRSNTLQPPLLLRPFDGGARLPHDGGTMGALQLVTTACPDQSGACSRKDFGVVSLGYSRQHRKYLSLPSPRGRLRYPNRLRRPR